MAIISEKQTELRKKISIELCENFRKRLNPLQKREIKLNAILGIRNFIKESKIEDPILLNLLIDTLADEDKKVREKILRVIKEIFKINSSLRKEIVELLEIKINEVRIKELKQEIINLVKELV